MRGAYLYKALLLAGAGIVTFTVSSPASASLIYDSTISVAAQGFGNVPRDLSVQETGSDDDIESGCVAVSGGAILIGPTACIADATIDPNGFSNTGGDEPPPLADNQKYGIPTLGSLGITDASEIFILFNPDEGQASDLDGITVTDLTLKFYDGDNLIAAIDGSHTFADTDPGVGQAGFVFRISDDEIPLVNTGVFGIAGFEDFRMALESTLANAQGGPDTFVILTGEGDIPVPEPAALGLLGLGMIGLLAGRRRRT